MQDFITMDMLISLAGCILIVTAVTQIAKRYININAKWFTLVFSIIIAIARIIVVGDFSLMGIVLGILNIIPIMFGAIGGYETVVKPIARNMSKDKTES